MRPFSSRRSFLSEALYQLPNIRLSRKNDCIHFGYTVILGVQMPYPYAALICDAPDVLSKAELERTNLIDGLLQRRGPQCQLELAGECHIICVGKTCRGLELPEI